MREAVFKRPGHRVVAEVLAKLDPAFLASAGCCFGGGTRIVLELGEYRESRDIDFLCSAREGYRRLRDAVSESSLGAIAKQPLTLARDVRADQYGIRTFLATTSAPLKFEIIREARIDLEAGALRSIPVPCLTRRHCFAEKFLANADRGLDASTLSRDIVDLAFMIESWSQADADAGMAIAEAAYGNSVRRALVAATTKMRTDRAYRNRCVEGLAISDTGPLTAGLKALAAYARS